MRFSKMMLCVGALALSGMGALAACGGETGGTGGSGNTGNTGTGNTGTTTGTDTGNTCTAACCPKATCTAADKECIGLVDNKGQTTFGLRMSQLDITAPAALSSGLVAQLVSAAVMPKNSACYLGGSASFSWLLQFDTTTGKIKTGGAKPVADATAGYSFINETMQGVAVAPAELDAKPDASGKFSSAAGVDLVVPIYIDASTVVLLPLKQAKFANGTLSASQNCIGHFNAEGLDPNDGCLATSKVESFVTGADLSGMITLEDADKVIVSSASVSLCFLLTGNDPQYGQTSGGNTVCKRDASNVITFKGDACVAGGTCGDAMNLAAKFAASSVKIN